MTDLREAAEMALEALETLWDILDDIDTASDMAKENDAWYRKRVEALQKKRWDTTITTDGYKLKGGPVEALRQALAQYVDAVNISEERVHKTEKSIHEPVAFVNGYFGGYLTITCFDSTLVLPDGLALYTAPPKREWVGLSDDEVSDILDREIGFNSCWGPETDFARAIEQALKEKNGG